MGVIIYVNDRTFFACHKKYYKESLGIIRDTIDTVEVETDLAAYPGLRYQGMRK